MEGTTWDLEFDSDENIYKNRVIGVKKTMLEQIFKKNILSSQRTC